MHRVKTIVLWILGAFLLSTLGAVIFLATANDDFYRWAMQQAIEGTIDREIRVGRIFLIRRWAGAHPVCHRRLDRERTLGQQEANGSGRARRDPDRA